MPILANIELLSNITHKFTNKKGYVIFSIHNLIYRMETGDLV